MSKLTAAMAAALRDARRAEEMFREYGSRRAFAADPESGLDQFELRARAALEDFGTREARTERREIAVRVARRTAAL